MLFFFYVFVLIGEIAKFQHIATSTTKTVTSPYSSSNKRRSLKFNNTTNPNQSPVTKGESRRSEMHISNPYNVWPGKCTVKINANDPFRKEIMPTTSTQNSMDHHDDQDTKDNEK